MRRLLGLAGCILLGSCGNQSTAGGGSDQPNSLDAMVLRQDGTPAAGAAARWVSGDWNPSDTSSALLESQLGEELRVGMDGRLVATKPGTGRWHLEIIDSAARQVAVFDSLPKTMRLEPASQWSGVVVSRGALPTVVGLAGTSRTARIGPDRRFRLEWIPSGTYRVLGTWSQQSRHLATKTFEAGDDLSNDTLDADSAEVELIDLQRMPLRSALRGHFWPDHDTFSGQWFLSCDSSSRVQPSASAFDPTTALRIAGPERSMKWYFRLGTKPILHNGEMKNPWAGVGIWLAPTLRGLDWSGVTALRLKVRGKGAFRVQVQSWLVDSLNSWGHLGYVFTAEAEWLWIDIPVQSLWPQGPILGRGISWPEVAPGIHSMSFIAFQTDTYLEIADIRVRGYIEPLDP